MGTRIRLGIGILAIITVIGGGVWYFTVVRPRADLATNETAQSLVTQQDLQGSGTNVAEVQDVVVDGDGTIHLAPAQ